MQYLASAFSYPDLTAAKLAVRNVGAMIADRGTPSDFGPLIYAFTGSGNVTKARIGDCLKNEYGWLLMRPAGRVGL